MALQKTQCPECKGTDLTWEVVTTTSYHHPATHPQAQAYLSCNECSETVAILQENELEALLNRAQSLFQGV